MSKVKLREVAEIIVGYPFESAAFNLDGAGIRLVRGMNVTERSLRFGEDTRWWNDFSINLDRYYLKEFDILIGMDGSKVGKNFALVSKEQLPLLLVQRVACIRAKQKVNQLFLWFCISGKQFTNYIETVKTGSSIPHISAEQIGDFEINLPSIDVQNRIADTLSQIENKIMLNNKTNKILEVMAKTVYDYWFLQFDFPDENGRPYKSSGGKMVWNEELKREIPEKFKVIDILDVCEIVDCLHSQKPVYRYEKEQCYLLALENITKEGYIDLRNKYYISESDYKEWTSRICVRENDFVVTNAGRAGDIGKIPKGIECAIGRNITAIRPKKINPYYLRQFFKSNYVAEQIANNLDCGAFFKSFNVKSIKQIKILLPDERSMERYTLLAEETVNRIECNVRENDELSKIRGFLLPLLMNGQVGFR